MCQYIVTVLNKRDTFFKEHIKWIPGTVIAPVFMIQTIGIQLNSDKAAAGHLKGNLRKVDALNILMCSTDF